MYALRDMSTDAASADNSSKSGLVTPVTKRAHFSGELSPASLSR